MEGKVCLFILIMVELSKGLGERNINKGRVPREGRGREDKGSNGGADAASTCTAKTV